MLLTENSQKWSQIIKEELGVKDENKLSWMSKYAQVHEIKESVQNGGARVDGGIYGTPLNTLGMGNPMMPTDSTPGTEPLIGTAKVKREKIKKRRKKI